MTPVQAFARAYEPILPQEGAKQRDTPALNSPPSLAASVPGPLFPSSQPQNRLAKELKSLPPRAPCVGGHKPLMATAVFEA